MGHQDTEQTARRVFFSGRVQGVGFRYTSCQMARRFEVTGYVKNLPDGRVELLCEGLSEETVRFIDAVYQAMNEFIGEMHTNEEPPSGQYRQFGTHF